MSSLLDIYNSSFGAMGEAANKIGAQNSFKETCSALIIKAYKIFQAKKSYSPTWEEDTFTANLKVELDNICIEENLPYHVSFQDHQITKPILDGEVSSRTGKKLDIVFSTFYRPKKLLYAVEAKILCDNNFATRNAGRLSREYVTAGMDRFVNKEYEIEGCMIGYVVHGDADNIVARINQVLLEADRGDEQLIEKYIIEEYTNCYKSSHPEFSLRHFMLYFS